MVEGEDEDAQKDVIKGIIACVSGRSLRQLSRPLAKESARTRTNTHTHDQHHQYQEDNSCDPSIHLYASSYGQKVTYRHLTPHPTHTYTHICTQTHAHVHVQTHLQTCLSKWPCAPPPAGLGCCLPAWARPSWRGWWPQAQCGPLDSQAMLRHRPACVCVCVCVRART
eukprot:515014-Pelagomonas_calceolata.AAC.8